MRKSGRRQRAVLCSSRRRLDLQRRAVPAADGSALRAHGASVLGVETVPRDQTGSYGIVAVETEKSRAQRVTKIVEKPKPADAPSNLAVVGRYILTPAIFTEATNARSEGPVGRSSSPMGLRRCSPTSPCTCWRSPESVTTAAARSVTCARRSSTGYGIPSSATASAPTSRASGNADPARLLARGRRRANGPPARRGRRGRASFPRHAKTPSLGLCSHIPVLTRSRERRSTSTAAPRQLPASPHVRAANAPLHAAELKVTTDVACRDGVESLLGSRGAAARGLIPETL